MIDLITFTHQIAMSLHRVGLAGAGVDIPMYQQLKQQWSQDAARLHDKLMKLALRKGMKQFVATNDSHIREVIYDKLKFPVLVKTKKDGLPAVDKPTLKRLLKEHGKSEFIDTLIEFNAVDKLSSTWAGREDSKKKRKSIGELIVPVSDVLGLLHFWVFPLRARTGRRASGGGEEGDPEGRNAQNWHPKARKMIRSRWKKSKIAVADFSKLEVVLSGWRAQDAKLIDYFLHGKGYIGVAKELWGQDVKDGTPLYKATKEAVLGLIYGMSAWTLAERFWFKAEYRYSEDYQEHYKQTMRLRKRFLRMFPGVKRNINRSIREVIETQQIISATGRIRHLPHHGVDSAGFWHVKNQGVNFPIQSYASEVTGSSIVDYEEALLKEHNLSYIDWHTALLEHPEDPPCSPVFNEVHDELDLDLHPKSGKRDLEILVDCMRNVRTLKKLVPSFDLTLNVDVQVVDTWGDAK